MDRPSTLPRLLLVDDDPLVLRAVGRLMARHFEVRTARGSDAAIAALEQSAEIDAFVFDMHMPPVDGPELFAQVMQRWPELRGRTAVVTGAPDAEDVRDFASRERIAIIAKPFSVSEMVAWINTR